jgi:hypothetical protein
LYNARTAADGIRAKEKGWRRRCLRPPRLASQGAFFVAVEFTENIPWQEAAHRTAASRGSFSADHGVGGLHFTKAAVQLFRHNLNAGLKKHIRMGARHILDFQLADEIAPTVIRIPVTTYRPGVALEK